MPREDICTGGCKECGSRKILVKKFLGLEKYYCVVKGKDVWDIESRFCEEFICCKKECEKCDKRMEKM